MLTQAEKISIYLRAFSMENSLLQSYRSLFTGIEAALFAFVFALIKLFNGRWVLGIGVCGILIGVMWIIVCRAKGKDVDLWRDSILAETKEKNEIKDCFTYLNGKSIFSGGKVARIWFNLIMPFLIILLWILIIID